jgi:hypothetical protein
VTPGRRFRLSSSTNVGGIGLLGTLARLDLVAKSYPPQAEGTCFAPLISLDNGGAQSSQRVGG